MQKLKQALNRYKPQSFENAAILSVMLLTAILGSILLTSKRNTPGGGHTHGHGDAHGHGQDPAHEEEVASVELNEGTLASSQIEIAEAHPATLKEVVKVRGRITVNRDRYTEIGSRFSGTIVRIHKKLGDSVQQGETLAVVEAAAARSAFEIKSGISGVVVALNGARGLFVTDKEPFITIADLSEVWAEFDVADGASNLIKVGQKVEIQNAESAAKTNSTLFYASSHISEDTQSLSVRAKVDNPDGTWRPGTFIEGKIFALEHAAAVVVKNEGLQTIEGKIVVFVKAHDQFFQRPVRIGRADSQYTEIKNGLKVGESYVTSNSFILKSEFLKATAGHEH